MRYRITNNSTRYPATFGVGVVVTGAISLMLLIVIGVTAGETHAAPNYEINYQGKLTNASNVAVADGTYNMRFWLTTTPTIATTSAVWSEELTGTDRVQVSNGLFSVMLGSTSPLTGVDFNQTLYLGVEIGGTSTPAWDGEMSPRKILGAVPAAFEAKNAETFGGIATTSFLRSDQADTASALLTFTGGIVSTASSTISDLTTLFATTTNLIVNGERFTDLTGSGFTNSSNALTCATASGSIFGCLTSADWTIFMGKVSSTSIDTLAELEALQGGINIVQSTEMDTSAEIAGNVTDETGTAGNLVFSGNPLLAGFRSNASSTIGGGTGATGLTINGGATTTESAYVGREVKANGMILSYRNSQNPYLVLDNAGGNSLAITPSSSGVHLGSFGDGGSSNSDLILGASTAAYTYWSPIERMRISAVTGNVGIGTTSPSAKLTIADTDGGTSPLFTISSSTSGVATSTLFTVLANGNVGVGTTTAGQALTVSGNAYVRSVADNASAFVVATSGGTPILTVDTSTSIVYTGGSLNTGNSVRAPEKDATAPSYSFVNSTDTGIFSVFPSVIGFSNDGVESARFDALGNFGIGSSTPSRRLTVAGDIYTINSITAASSTLGYASSTALTLAGRLYDTSNSAGTNGYVLQTTGSGTQWVATSTLGITGGASTFLALTDTPSSFTANRIPFTNSGATALTDSANFTFNGSLLTVTGNLRATASSTIGDGTATGGLTISGGATTTGNAYVGGRVRVGTATGDTNVPFYVVSGGTPFGDGSHMGGTVASFQNSGSASDNASISLISGGSGTDSIVFGNSNTSGIGNINYTVANGFGFYVNSGSQASMQINAVGNVGIGTTSPSAKLTIADTDGGTSPLFTISSSTSGVATSTLFTVLANGNVGIGDSAPEFPLSIESGGLNSFRARHTGFGEFAIVQSSGGVEFMINGGSGVPGDLHFYSGASQGLSPSGTPNMTIMEAGNVGIGSSTPSRRLTVAGDIYTINSITAASSTLGYASSTALTLAGRLYDTSNSAGTNGYVLQTTGSGTQWVATSTLGLGGSSFSDSAGLAALLSDETGTGYSVFSANPLLSGFRSNASSTIGGGTGATGLTVNGGATTTGNAYFAGNVGIGVSPNPNAALSAEGTYSNVFLNYGSGGNVYGVYANGGDCGGSLCTGIYGTTPSNSNTSARAGRFDLMNTNGYGVEVVGGSVTTGRLLSLEQYNSAFTGTAILAKLASGSGSFTGAFLDFQKNGVSQFYVDDDGSLGIGSSTPSAKLTIADTDGGTSPLFTISSSTNGVATSTLFTVLANGSVGVGTVSPANGTKLHATDGTAYAYLAASDGGTSNEYGVLGNGGDCGGLACTGIVGGTTSNPNDSAYAAWFALSNTNGTAVNISANAVTTGRMLNLEQYDSTFSGTTILANMADTTGSFTGAFLDFQKNGVSQFYVDGNGSLGIGSSTPSAKLTIADTDGGTSPLFTISSSTNGVATSTLFTVLANGSVGVGTETPVAGMGVVKDTFYFITEGGESMINGYNGRVGIGSNNTPSGILSVENTTSYSSFIVGDQSGDTTPFIIDADGLVGIGTTSPSRLLTIQGGDLWLGGNFYATGTATTTNLAVAGKLYDGAGTAGTNGYVLQTTGSGTQWVATSTLGITGGASTFLALTDTPSSFTANRIPFTNSGATALTDSANFTFNGSLLTVTGNLRATASSTIGDGTATGGLTVSGGATTTGNAYFGGTVGVGAATPSGSKLYTTDGVAQAHLSRLDGGYEYGVYGDGGDCGGGECIGVYGRTTTNSNALSRAGKFALANANGVGVLVESGTVTTGNPFAIAHYTSAFTGTAMTLNMAAGSGSFTGAFLDFRKNSVSQFYVDDDGSLGIGSSTPSAKLTIADTDGGTSPLFMISSSTSGVATSTLFKVLANGNVVIGGDSTSYKLDVQGQSYFADNAAINGYLTAGTANDGAVNTGLYLTNPSPSNGTGSSIKFTAYSAGYAALTTIGDIRAVTSDNTAGSVDSYLAFQTIQNNTLAERMRVDNMGNVGIGTTTPTARLTIDKSAITGSTVAGMKQYFGFTNSTESAVYYGDETYIVNAPTATSTLVGKMIRIEDTSALGNTVRGLEVQAQRGTNTKGENTGISAYGRTFGLRGTTLGDAGATYVPAGIFAESQGTTQGNALRAYSGTITTENLVSFFHDTSNFTGTGLQMSFGNSGGSFAATSSAKFIDLKSAGSSRFIVSANGSTTIGNGTVSAGLIIPYGGICVDNDGSCVSTTTGQIRSVTSALGNSDLAEVYFSSQSLSTGEIVSLTGGLSVARANEESETDIIGVVSTKPGMTLGYDDSSLIPNERGYPVGLKGRVPIKLSTENGPIKKGDRIMLSSISGIGMKATESARVVGIALEDYDGTKAYSAGFLNQFGDDMVKERIVRQDAIDSRTQDGCSYGGGSALGDTPCVKRDVDSATTTARLDSTRDDVLASLKHEAPEERTTESGMTVYIGQAIMFIELGWYTSEDERTLLSELVATTTESGEETLWDRVKILAQNFVDGVLAVVGVQAERVEVGGELCVGDVCVDEATFLRMVNSSAASAGGASEETGNETGGDGSGTGETPIEEPPVETVEPSPVEPSENVPPTDEIPSETPSEQTGEVVTTPPSEPTPDVVDAVPSEPEEPAVQAEPESIPEPSAPPTE